MSTKKNREKEVKWVYGNDADITIGEVKVSKLPKILLILLISLLLATAGAGYYFREIIYDFIVKPEIILKEEEVTLEVGDKFDPMEYIAKLPADGLEPDRYEITYPKSSSVNTTKTGDYNVSYITHIVSNDTESTANLVVHVVDTQAPKIVLTEHNIELTREVDTFECMKYVESVTDNYDKSVQVKCSDNIDWSSNKVVVDYISSDLSGNQALEKLEISIKDKPKPSYQCWDGSVAWNAAGCPARPQQQSSGGSSSGGSSSSGGGGSSSGGGGTSYVPVDEAPYIHCPSCSISVGDAGGLTSCLSGTSSNRTVSIDFSSVNLSSPGSYSVSVSATDGSVSTSCGVTVHE